MKALEGRRRTDREVAQRALGVMGQQRPLTEAARLALQQEIEALNAAPSLDYADDFQGPAGGFRFTVDLSTIDGPDPL